MITSPLPPLKPMNKKTHSGKSQCWQHRNSSTGAADVTEQHTICTRHSLSISLYKKSVCCVVWCGVSVFVRFSRHKTTTEARVRSICNSIRTSTLIIFIVTPRFVTKQPFFHSCWLQQQQASSSTRQKHTRNDDDDGVNPLLWMTVV